MKFDLEIKAQLENVKEIGPVDLPSFPWHIKFRCTGCGEIKENFRILNIQEKFPNKGGRGESNFVETCHFCGRVNTADFLDEVKFSYTDEDDGKFKAICRIDCRGLEPVEYEFADGFKVSAANSRTVFDNVDLGDKEWTDYDDVAKESVGIMELESRFEKRK